MNPRRPSTPSTNGRDTGGLFMDVLRDTGWECAWRGMFVVRDS
jgi:hypothetical protein